MGGRDIGVVLVWGGAWVCGVVCLTSFLFSSWLLFSARVLPHASVM